MKRRPRDPQPRPAVGPTEEPELPSAPRPPTEPVPDSHPDHPPVHPPVPGPVPTREPPKLRLDEEK